MIDRNVQSEAQIGPTAGPESRSDLEREVGRLYAVLEVNAILSSTLNLRVVLETLMAKAGEVMTAEASSLMLVDEETQELYFHVLKNKDDAQSEALRSIRLKLGEGIAGWVAKNAQPVLVEDCSKDPRFSRRGDQVSHFVTRTMMCVPLRVRSRVLGTIQVLNKRDGSFFNDRDLRIFETLATQAAIAIENARLHEMATVDATTRLYMKGYFLARLSEEFRRAKASGRPLSLLMTDIDFFKKVNDRFGHQGGDAALVSLAEVVIETVQDIGGELMAGRYGGEEFCVLMPDTNTDLAMEYGERIRKNIESKPISVGTEDAHITISIGVSSYPLHRSFIEKDEDFVRLADEALFICKRRGRNCVTMYEENHPDAKIELKDERGGG